MAVIRRPAETLKDIRSNAVFNHEHFYRIGMLLDRQV